MHNRTCFSTLIFSALILFRGISGFASDSEKPVVTLVHITDVHLRTKFDAPERLKLAFHHIQQSKPDLVVNTGDSIDGPNDTIDHIFDAPQKWRDWKTALQTELNAVPLFNLLGNHDIDAPITRQQACNELEMPSAYYRFDKNGWRFLMLDGNDFSKDKKQWAWILEELQSTPQSTPIAIASHHPIFSMGAMIHCPDAHLGRWKELVALFTKYPNVKLCLSGHSHLADVVRYNGVTYAAGGSVSGYWWEIVKSSDGKGSYYQTPPGYNVIKLSPTDVLSVDYVRYPDPATTGNTVPASNAQPNR